MVSVRTWGGRGGGVHESSSFGLWQECPERSRTSHGHLGLFGPPNCLEEPLWSRLARYDMNIFLVRCESCRFLCTLHIERIETSPLHPVGLLNNNPTPISHFNYDIKNLYNHNCDERLPFPFSVAYVHLMIIYCVISAAGKQQNENHNSRSLCYSQRQQEIQSPLKYHFMESFQLQESKTPLY
jgi:hypothetical protein